MAKRKRKATLHSAGRVTEAEILEAARALADDPSLAIPICEDGCVLFSPVKAARKGIMQAHAARDDESKLQRLASSGNDLARAYAATLLIGRAEKIPFVADLTTPSGKVPYVIRGSAKPFYLAGLQHHDDRMLRLLSVTQWVRKRGLHFYSADRGIVCTGKRASPPRDFVEEEMEVLGLTAEGPDRFTCGHGGDGVRLRWRDAGVNVERCLDCARGTSTLSTILQHVAAPSPAKGFDIEARLDPLIIQGGSSPDESFELDASSVLAYRKGGMSDAQLVDAARAARTRALRAQSGPLFVGGNASFGDDAEAFLRVLNPTGVEERVLRAALAASPKAVVLDKASSARALAALWPTQGREMLLEASSGDEVVVEALFTQTATPEQAADLVRKAAKQGAAHSVGRTLPIYPRTLPPVAETADAIARAFRARGSEAAVRVALERAAMGRGKGVALAALQSLKAAKGQEWRFSGADTDVARLVSEDVETLLRGDAARYHATLANVSRSAGETQKFEPQP